MGLRTEAARSLAWRGLGAAEGHCVNSRDTAAYDEQPSLPRTVANSDTPLPETRFRCEQYCPLALLISASLDIDDP
jgi:hypothetical protein